MTTSTLPLQPYPEPSLSWSQASTVPFLRPDWRGESWPTETGALNALYFSRHDPSSPSSLAPYLHRVFWVLTSSEGCYLKTINGRTMQFVHTANEVPPEHRFCSFERAKSVWVQVSNLLSLQDCSLAIRPVDFYAHRSSPTVWCACDD